MAYNMDVAKIRVQIRHMEQNAEKLKKQCKNFPFFEKNMARMLASLKMLELNLPEECSAFEEQNDDNICNCGNGDSDKIFSGASSLFSRDFSALMDTALKKRFPDLVIKNGRLVNVYTGEICEDTCISVCGERIAFVGQGDDFTKGPDTIVIDAENNIIIPGLIDGHTHLACLVTPCEFLRYAIKGGTTTIITETMEVFPVAGAEGVEDFMASMDHQPVKIFSTAPSTSSISTNIIGMSEDIFNNFLCRDDVLGLGESYWQMVFQSPEKFLPSFKRALEFGKTIEGHSAGARGRKLAAYASLGISSCHEPINADQVLERLRLGIYVMAREGSIRSDLEAIAPIKDEAVDLRHLCFASDSITPAELIKNGYMENILQKAIDAGFDPIDAIRGVTLNVAEHFGISDHVGGIAPGRYADILIVPDIKKIYPQYVISCGKIVAEKGELLINPRVHEFKKESRKTVRIPKKFIDRDFTISVKDDVDEVKIRIIQLVTDLVTKENIISAVPIGGKIVQDVKKDILKLVAVDRSLNKGEFFTGLISGFGIKSGAFAATGAWDSADIIAVGANDQDIAFAINRVHELNGGIVVCDNGKILAELALPLFGLMSELSIDEIAEKIEKINTIVQDMGCGSHDPLLTLVTLTGAAIPYIRICEQGLVNLKDGEKVSLFP